MVFVDGRLSRSDHLILQVKYSLQLVDFVCIKVTAGAVSQLITSFMLVPIWHVLLHDFLFTCMIVHGCAPSGFGASSIIPIPKKHNINVADSNNFLGIALSSVFCSEYFTCFLILLFLRNFLLICALLIFSLVSNLGILLACVPWSSKRLLLIMLQII